MIQKYFQSQEVFKPLYLSRCEFTYVKFGVTKQVHHARQAYVVINGANEQQAGKVRFDTC